METVNCFEPVIFSQVVTFVEKKGKETLLDAKIVTQKGTKATVFVVDSFMIAAVGSEEDTRLIVIDETHKNPTFTISVDEENHLDISAYASRIDSEEDIQQRKETWCTLVTKILK
ncbi:hypothetical protein C8N46_104255 [Kordia periserrulae]|uniref:Uncharacterized protein n=1 Tax=Kordia periserrulae TaxID=701523 RepID=A0A2T6BZW6_9FLAO|nr:hypothetical protein [Kordia periserrulae]PTX61612.1 hypothetical protein C8N46_104255 [Kordia periserrulae]